MGMAEARGSFALYSALAAFGWLVGSATPGQACPAFEPAVSLGQVAVTDLTEASGLASSRSQTGILWTHNDSGDSARVFAIESDGSLRAEYSLLGASNQDWEDMAIGPGPIEGQDYLYLADIGDNASARNTVTVYRLPEPQVPLAATSIPIEVAGAVALELEYPDGAHDAETLLVDPETADLYILTKDGNTGVSGLYGANYPQNRFGISLLVHHTDITFSGNVFERPATGGDISVSGDEILVRTYLSAHLWSRTEGESISSAMESAACVLPLALELQGEAIAFASGGQNYLTVSEGSNPPVYEYRRVSVVSGLGIYGILGLMGGLAALGISFSRVYERLS